VSDIIYSDFPPDHPVQRSLSALSEAHFQLQSLNPASVTSDVIACQIALYDLILSEILAVRNGLTREFEGPSPDQLPRNSLSRFN
jgi:hypothetical protein